MTKIIICIHGRSNKPKKKILRGNWRKAIEEGLGWHTEMDGLGDIPLKMAYWANVSDNPPLKDDPEPYKPAQRPPKRYDEGLADWFKQLAVEVIERPLELIDATLPVVTRMGYHFLKACMKDVGDYFTNQTVHDQINRRLIEMLERHAKDEIILIAHSMGTVIAYDVLRALGRDPHYSRVKIEHFITLGSPLGLSLVKAHFHAKYQQRLRTPSCVTGTWYNFSDKGDEVCIDAYLSNDYAANSSGVKVVDDLVLNDFPDNPHKSYGYLRTPEFSRHLASLL